MCFLLLSLPCLLYSLHFFPSLRGLLLITTFSTITSLSCHRATASSSSTPSTPPAPTSLFLYLTSSGERCRRFRRRSRRRRRRSRRRKRRPYHPVSSPLFTLSSFLGSVYYIQAAKGHSAGIHNHGLVVYFSIARPGPYPGRSTLFRPLSVVLLPCSRLSRHSCLRRFHLL